MNAIKQMLLSSQRRSGKTAEVISSLIRRRRLQILVHSYIYYELDQNIISDETWSKWALQLENLQQKYPEIADTVEYAEVFKNFDHSTGQDLKSAYMLPNIQSTAHRLLDYENKMTSEMKSMLTSCVKEILFAKHGDIEII